MPLLANDIVSAVLGQKQVEEKYSNKEAKGHIHWNHLSFPFTLFSFFHCRIRMTV